VEVEWGGWGGDEAICTYAPEMFYDESGDLLPFTVSAAEMGLPSSEIWRLISYYELYNASSAKQEDPSNPSRQFLTCERMYEELRDSVLRRAVQVVEARNTDRLARERSAMLVEVQEEGLKRAEKAAKKECDAPITSAAYWRHYLKAAEEECEKAVGAVVATPSPRLVDSDPVPVPAVAEDSPEKESDARVVFEEEWRTALWHRSRNSWLAELSLR